MLTEQEFDNMTMLKNKLATIPTSYNIKDKINNKMKEIKLSVEDFDFEYHNLKYTVIPTYKDYKNVIEKVTFDVDVYLKRQVIQPPIIKMRGENIELGKPKIENVNDYIPFELITEKQIIDGIKYQVENEILYKYNLLQYQVAKTDVIMEYDGFCFSGDE